jgi:hypothetical protein
VQQFFQRDKLNDIITEMGTIEYPESDVEVIDAALAKHDDRKAALQIQRDILNHSKADAALQTPRQNGDKRSSDSSSSSSSDDEDEIQDVQVRGHKSLVNI